MKFSRITAAELIHPDRENWSIVEIGGADGTKFETPAKIKRVVPGRLPDQMVVEIEVPADSATGHPAWQALLRLHPDASVGIQTH